MDNENGNGNRRHTGLEFQTKWGTLKLRGLGTVLTLILVAIILETYVMYEHMRSTDRFSDQYIAAMRVVSESIDDAAISQRELACINSKEGEERRRAYQSGECRVQAETGTRKRRNQ